MTYTASYTIALFMAKVVFVNAILSLSYPKFTLQEHLAILFYIFAILMEVNA